MLRFWKRLNELYGWFVILVFGFVMLIGVWQVYDNYYTFKHSLDESILRYKPGSPDNDGTDPPITDDMVGWLTLDGTNIDYPVMQGDDNTVYLSTDPFGEYSLSGSVFLDCRSSPDFSDSYCVVYGHHMDYGKMFGALDGFLNEKYLKEHSSGTLMVGRNAEKVYKLRVFASMKVNVNEKIVFDMDQDGIRQFVHDNALVLTRESADERIIALSTCIDADSLKRIVVFCYIYE